MPDTDAAMRDDLNRLSHSTTAADLVKERGETKRVKVMSKRRLQELIHGVVAAEMARYADRLEEDERRHMEEVAERRVKQVLERAGKEEQELNRRSEETTSLMRAIGQKIEQADLMDETMREGLEHLAGLIAQSESMTHYCLHNTMCLKEEMDKLRHLADVHPEDTDGPQRGMEDTILLREVTRGRCLLELCRACEALVDCDAVLDLAVLLDETPGKDQVQEMVVLNDAIVATVASHLSG